MVTAERLNEIVNGIAPYELAEEWDNCGLLINCGDETDKVLFALDLTDAVVKEAITRGCGAVVTHHPAIFRGMKNISVGEPVFEAVKAGISVVSAHTCYDAAEGGVNDVLCALLGIAETEVFGGIGRGGKTEPIQPDAFAQKVKEWLNCAAVRYTDGGRTIKRVAVIGGAAGEYIYEAAALGYDAFVTGELKHHEAIDACRLGLTVVQAGHYETENPSIEALLHTVEKALDGAAECLLSECCANPLKCC